MWFHFSLEQIRHDAMLAATAAAAEPATASAMLFNATLNKLLCWFMFNSLLTRDKFRYNIRFCKRNVRVNCGLGTYPMCYRITSVTLRMNIWGISCQFLTFLHLFWYVILY